MTPHTARPAEEAPIVKVGRGYAWVVFALTFVLLLSDYMSRQVLSSVFPLLKADWRLSDTQLGSLGGVVALAVGVLTIPLSLVADRWGRAKCLALMAVLWSLATLAGGLARNYDEMLASRLFVGVGEAAYGSVGVAVALSVFPAHMRATITGAFMAGGVFGSVLGTAWGGAVAQSFGWRWSFSSIALFGLVLAVIFPFIVRDSIVSPRREGPARGAPRRAGAPSLIQELFATPTQVLAYVGSGLQLFVMGGLIAWMPSFLNRAYGLSPAKAGSGAGVLVLICGVGMIVCGMVADQCGRIRGDLKPALAAIYCLLTLVILSLAFAAPHGRLQLELLAGGMFFAAGSTGPAGAVVADLSRVAIHGTVFATLTLVNNLLGLAPGPVVTGLVADHAGLSVALQLVPAAAGVAALMFWLCRGRYAGDLARARRALSPETGGDIASGAGLQALGLEPGVAPDA